jgi:hypothetical protein
MTGICKSAVGARFFGVCGGLILLGTTLLIGGCGKGETILRADVKYDGKPVTGGMLDLNSKPGKAGEISSEGKVEIKGVPGGKWKVTFTPPGDTKDFSPAAALTDKKINDFNTTPIEVEIKDGQTNTLTIELKK